MPDAPPATYWDACAFLSYINEEPDRIDTVSELLECAARGEIRIYTSVLSRVEVAFSAAERQARILNPDTERMINALWNDGTVVMVELHEAITDMAQSLIRQAIANGVHLKPYDAAHLATAKCGCPIAVSP